MAIRAFGFGLTSFALIGLDIQPEAAAVMRPIAATGGVLRLVPPVAATSGLQFAVAVSGAVRGGVRNAPVMAGTTGAQRALAPTAPMKGR